ncbi:hypothetical protein L7F22_054014 [Adiantum nelumboides]|nr:hypothetical protein [Adiantum nelumboides]
MNPFNESYLDTSENFMMMGGETQIEADGDDVFFSQIDAFARQLQVFRDDESVTLSPNTTMSPGTPSSTQAVEVEAAPAPVHVNTDQSVNLFTGLSNNLDAILSNAAFAPTPQQQQAPPIRPHRTLFPQNHFSNLSKQNQKNLQAARNILSTLKVLAINENPRGSRYTLMSEKNAVLSMSANYTLNIEVNQNQPISDLLKRGFSKYDHVPSKKDFNRDSTNVGRTRFKDCAERAFLMVAVRLLRHKFMYEPPAGTNKHYASDFEALLPKSSMCKNKRLFVKRSKDLCRIIVACGHPCIILILVRIAIRRGIQLTELLDRLPIQQFCHFLSTGQVCETNLHAGPSTRTNSGHQVELDLLYAREYILMPLLCIASQRVPQTFFMFDGNVVFNVQACLTAIVPHAFRSRYAAFLRSEVRHDAWDSGEVVVETSCLAENDRMLGPTKQNDPDEISDPSDDEESINESQCREAEYSIRKDKRTFHNFNFAKYSVIEEVINNPPAFLKNRVLNLTTDD